MSLNSPRLKFALFVIAVASSLASSIALGQTKRTFDNSSTPTPGAEQYFDGPAWTGGKWAGLAFPIGEQIEGAQGNETDLGFFGNPAVTVDNPIILSTNAYQSLTLGGWSFNSNGAGATTYSLQAQGSGGPMNVTLKGLGINFSDGDVSGTGTGNEILVVSDLSVRDVNIGVGSAQALNLILGTSDAQGEIYVTSGRTMTIGSVISGAGKGIDKTGAGTLSLSGANTFTGTTTLSSGTIRMGVVSSGSVGSITSSAIGRGGLVLNGGTLSSGDTTARTVLNAYTVGGDITLGNATNNGALTFSAAGTLTGSRTLTVDSSVTLSGTLGESSPGVGALTKAGAGTLTLSGNNTNGYTGLTTINAGTLIVSGGNAIVNSGAVTMTGGTFQLNNNETIGSLSGSAGTVSLGSNTLTVGDATSTTFAGSISGTNGQLVKQGNGTLTLTSANAYTGATSINGGVLNIRSADGLGGTSGATSVASGAALELQGGLSVGAEALTLNGTGISSAGALRNISGDNTFAGLINLGSATRINSEAGTLTLSNVGTITGGFGLTVGGAGNTSIASIIGTGAGTLTKDGSGTLTLSGANTYGGGTTVSGGTLIGTTTSLQGAIANDSAVHFNQASTGDFGGSISGAGTVTIQGGGTVSFSADNTYSGTTTINNGSILQVGNGGASGSLGTSDVVANGTLQFNRSDDLTFTNLVSGSGGIVKNGGNTLTLGAVQTYTGNTVVNFGKLEIGDFGGFSSAAGTISTGATGYFGINRSDDVSYSSVAGGRTFAGGNFYKDGFGKLDLDTDLTFSGGIDVLGGALQINAAISADLVNVEPAGTLGGNGTFNGHVNIDSGATLAPGNSIDTLNIYGNLDLAGVYEFEFDQLALSGDLTVVDGSIGSGNINLTGASLSILPLSPEVVAPGTKYTLFAYAGALTSVFSNQGSFSDWVFNYSDTSAGVNGDGGLTGGRFVTITAVPEPSAALLLGGLLAGAACLRRRRVA